MLRIIFLFVALILNPALSASTPHLLMLVIDDLGWNGSSNRGLNLWAWSHHMLADLHFRGAEFTTPNIDALAQSGVILDQYYVQARVMS